jgi:hypothetical protein
MVRVVLRNDSTTTTNDNRRAERIGRLRML